MGIKNFSREEFIQSIIGATLASLSGHAYFSGKATQKSKSSGQIIEIPDKAVILFQGDSITDAGRDRKEESPNTAGALGHGYALLASSEMLAEFPGRSITCYNRGIGGDKVFQLADRWKRDCIDLQPDILSILVGVNDFWHTLDFNYRGDAGTYEKDYRALLKRTREALPEATLIIGEPFALEGGTAITNAWYPDFPKYREACRRIADDFDAAFIPYQSIFDRASTQVPAAYWSGDGVHPTLAGNQLMANAWLETLKRL
jgi:lysophospholipase L1-like esterase